MKSNYKINFLISILSIITMLSSCTLLEESKKANLIYDEVNLYWHYTPYDNYYYLSTSIENNGDADAKNVIIHYYYLDQGNMKKYEKIDYLLDSIPANSSITYNSSKIYESEYGCGIVRYGISEVTWK